MKKILKTILLTLLVGIFWSCEDDTKTVLSSNGFELRTTVLNSPLALQAANNNDVVATLEWDKSDNGTPSVTTYTVEILENGSSSNILTANLGNNIVVTNDSRTYTLKVGELNQLVNQLPNYACGQQITVDVRVKATVGGKTYNAFSQYSNTIAIKVTPYSTKTPELAFVTSPSEIATSSKMLSKGILDSEFEGYFYLQPGSYKFYQPSACGDFASATAIGGTAGTLDTDSGAPSITVATAGYYLVKANIDANTYSVSQYNYFGIYGKAKSTLFSDRALPFADDDHDNVWTITVELFKGRKFKLKSNYWTTPLTGTPPYIPSTAPIISALGKSSTAGQLVNVSSNLDDTIGLITVPGTDDGTKVTCIITIDVRNSRDYKYTLVTQ